MRPHPLDLRLGGDRAASRNHQGRAPDQWKIHWKIHWKIRRKIAALLVDLIAAFIAYPRSIPQGGIQPVRNTSRRTELRYQPNRQP